MTETKFGSFEDLLEITEEKLRPIVTELQKLIKEIDPDTFEVVRLGDRAATYGFGPKKMKEGYTYILPHKSWVNLGFFQGSSLVDHDGILLGTGKNMRHIKIYSVEDVSKKEIRHFIELAMEERRKTIG